MDRQGTESRSTYLQIGTWDVHIWEPQSKYWELHARKMELIGASIQVPEVSLHIRILEVLGPQFISSHHVRIWKYWDLKILSGELLVGRRTEWIQIRISPSKLGPGKKTSLFVSGSRICEEDNSRDKRQAYPDGEDDARCSALRSHRLRCFLAMADRSIFLPSR